MVFLRQIALTYGGVAGLIVCFAMFGSFLLLDQSYVFNELLGAVMMIPSFIIVVFGVKKFCDSTQPEVTRFTDGAIAGFSIVGVMSVIYAIGWEFYLYLTDYTFMDQYITNERILAEERGVHGAELALLQDQMQSAAEAYANPFFRFGITIMEIFPLGMLVALISVLLLRNPNLFKRSRSTK